MIGLFWAYFVGFLVWAILDAIRDAGNHVVERYLRAFLWPLILPLDILSLAMWLMYQAFRVVHHVGRVIGGHRRWCDWEVD